MRKYCVFQIFLLSGIKPCSNIINFDIVDFSEPRPEKSDKFLLTLSVCLSCFIPDILHILFMFLLHVMFSGYE